MEVIAILLALAVVAIAWGLFRLLTPPGWRAHRRDLVNTAQPQAIRPPRPGGRRRQKVRFHNRAGGGRLRGRAGQVPRPAGPVRLGKVHPDPQPGRHRATRQRAGAPERSAGGRRGQRHLAPERRNLAMVFQDYALWPHLTVLGNVGYALRRRRLAGATSRTRVEAALERVGLGRHAARYPHELSGGEQQRVALARAVVAEPQLLLFDEPLSNLDADLRERLRVEIATLTRESGATAIYITHDQAEAFALADTSACLTTASLLQLARPEEVYRRPAKPVRRPLHWRRRRALRAGRPDRRRATHTYGWTTGSIASRPVHRRCLPGRHGARADPARRQPESALGDRNGRADTPANTLHGPSPTSHTAAGIRPRSRCRSDEPERDFRSGRSPTRRPGERRLDADQCLAYHRAASHGMISRYDSDLTTVTFGPG